MTHPCSEHGSCAEGAYYVSVRDGRRSALVLGPFPIHQLALDRVSAVKKRVVEDNPWAWFYAWGTARWAEDEPAPAGVLNKELSHLLYALPVATVPSRTEERGEQPSPTFADFSERRKRRVESSSTPPFPTTRASRSTTTTHTCETT